MLPNTRTNMKNAVNERMNEWMNNARNGMLWCGNLCDGLGPAFDCNTYCAAPVLRTVILCFAALLHRFHRCNNTCWKKGQTEKKPQRTHNITLRISHIISHHTTPHHTSHGTKHTPPCTDLYKTWEEKTPKCINKHKTTVTKKKTLFI